MDTAKSCPVSPLPQGGWNVRKANHSQGRPFQQNSPYPFLWIGALFRCPRARDSVGRNAVPRTLPSCSICSQKGDTRRPC